VTSGQAAPNQTGPSQTDARDLSDEGWKTQTVPGEELPGVSCEGACCEDAREGYHQGTPPKNSGKFCCRRPGCFARFGKTARSPLRRFCKPACREPLRRVRLRDQRWDEILGTQVAQRWLPYGFG
jgi:hypothetical protein